MRSTEHVFWYRHNEGKGNFGDELNPYLIEKLSGRKVKFAVPYEDSNFNILRTLLFSLIKKRSVNEFLNFSGWNTLLNRKIVLGIGSIISVATPHHVVWGAGIITRKERIRPSTFLAVRGKYTQTRLRELGHQVPKVTGDPAILLPLIYKPQTSKKYKIGIIPHYVHYAEMSLRILDPTVKVINLLDNVETVIDDIFSCELTLSTSLHGIIVSHAYQIPSLWISAQGISGKRLAGDDIKFADYFSSVDLPEYEPIQINLANIAGLCWWAFKEKSAAKLPAATKVLQVQFDLLAVAPFKLKSKYKKWSK